MSDTLIEECEEAILPKLPFLLEDRDEVFVKGFFEDEDSFKDSKSGHSITARKRILLKLKETLEEEGSFSWWLKLTPKSRAKIIIFMSEHCDGSKLWSNLECHEIMMKICEEICRNEDSGVEEEGGYRGNDLSSWFIRNFKDSLVLNETDFHAIVQIVRKRVTKSEWKYFPASAHGFGWILQQVSIPYLSSDLDLIVPPALLFTDDYYDEHKILGLKCLNHIIHTVDKSDLLTNNWAVVIYDAVQRLCTDKDSLVVNISTKILMKLLEIIEKDPSTSSSEFTKYDVLLKQVLFQMEFGSDFNLRLTWLPILDQLLHKMGTATFHWSDKICCMLRDFTVSSNPAIWNPILQCITTVIKNTWLNVDCDRISEVILRVVFNVSAFQSISMKDEEKDEIFKSATHAFQLLQLCDGFDNVQADLKDIIEKNESNLLHPEFISAIKTLQIV